jgi:hypothetical protein
MQFLNIALLISVNAAAVMAALFLAYVQNK